MELIDQAGNALAHVDAILKLIDDGLDARTDRVVLMEALDVARMRLADAITSVSEAEVAERTRCAMTSSRMTKPRPSKPLANKKAVRR